VPEAQTESATDLYVPTVDDVSTRAYRRAGLLNDQQTPSTVQLNNARLLLSDLSDKLNALGAQLVAKVAQQQPSIVQLHR